MRVFCKRFKIGLHKNVQGKINEKKMKGNKNE